MTQEELNALLEAETQDQALKTLATTYTNKCNSNAQVKSYISDWAEVLCDKPEVQKREEGKTTNVDNEISPKNPVKLKAPVTKTQIDSLVALMVSILVKQNTLWKFTPIGGEDSVIEQAATRLLRNDFNHNNNIVWLTRFLASWCKCGIAVSFDSWVTETQKLPMLDSSNAPYYEDTVTFVGNRFKFVPADRFFYDSSFPIVDWARGRFVGFSEEVSLTDLKADTKLFGVKWLKETSYISDNIRLERIMNGLSGNVPKTNNFEVYTVYGYINPSKVIFADGSALGDLDVEVKYEIVFESKTSRILKLQPYTDCCSDWPVTVALYDPTSSDNPGQKALSFSSLVTELYDLQRVSNWLMTSRVAQVQRIGLGKVLANPRKVSIADILSDRPVITLTKVGLSEDPRSAVTPIELPDPTISHWTDLNVISDLARRTGGISESLNGNVAAGRRSAQEISTVTNASQTKLLLQARLLYAQAFGKQGLRLLSRHRAYMDNENFVAICGETQQEVFATFNKPINYTANHVDLFPFDEITESKTADIIQSLRELLQLVLTNPAAATMFGIDPRKIVTKLYTLQGLPDKLLDIAMDPTQQAQLMQQMSQPTNQLPSA